MTTVTEGKAADAPATRRQRFSAARLFLPVAAGVVVFVANNFLLARPLTALPGGTALAPTTMLALAWVTLRVRRWGAATLLYAAYGFLGTLGHLGVDAGTYLLHLPRVLAAAALFDAVAALGRFRPWALPLGLLPLAGGLLFGASRSPREWLVALGLAGAGVVAGILAHEVPRRRRQARAA